VAVGRAGSGQGLRPDRRGVLRRWERAPAAPERRRGLGVGLGAPHGARPLGAASVGTRGYRSPTPGCPCAGHHECAQPRQVRASSPACRGSVTRSAARPAGSAVTGSRTALGRLSDVGGSAAAARERSGERSVRAV